MCPVYCTGTVNRTVSVTLLIGPIEKVHFVLLIAKLSFEHAYWGFYHHFNFNLMNIITALHVRYNFNS